MSVLTEWFEGRSVEEHYQRCNWSRLLCECACLVVAGLILAGCATTKEEPRQEVCFFQYLGRTEGGLSVARTACMSEQAFAEYQK